MAVYIDALSLEHSNWTRYINTADDPADNNLAWRRGPEDDGRVFLVATRNIAAGERLFAPYRIG
jgi:hypothetical protein